MLRKLIQSWKSLWGSTNSVTTPMTRNELIRLVYSTTVSCVSKGKSYGPYITTQVNRHSRTEFADAEIYMILKQLCTREYLYEEVVTAPRGHPRFHYYPTGKRLTLQDGEWNPMQDTLFGAA